jgi:hypothetical protein
MTTFRSRTKPLVAARHAWTGGAVGTVNRTALKESIVSVLSHVGDVGGILADVATLNTIDSGIRCLARPVTGTWSEDCVAGHDLWYRKILDIHDRHLHNL